MNIVKLTLTEKCVIARALTTGSSEMKLVDVPDDPAILGRFNLMKAQFHITSLEWLEANEKDYDINTLLSTQDKLNRVLIAHNN
jgi:hypothetical protein